MWFWRVTFREGPEPSQEDKLDSFVGGAWAWFFVILAVLLVAGLVDLLT